MMRLRLLKRAEHDAIRDNGLHEALVSELAADVDRALSGVIASIRHDAILPLEEAAGALARLMAMQPGIERHLDNLMALDTSTLGREELLRAMAIWVIDRQLGGGVEYDPRDPFHPSA